MGAFNQGLQCLPRQNRSSKKEICIFLNYNLLPINILTYTTFTIFSMKYLIMRKVYNDVGGIKITYHVCPPVRKIIHSLKLVDYLYVQTDNSWYNDYLCFLLYHKWVKHDWYHKVHFLRDSAGDFTCFYIIIYQEKLIIAGRRT